MSYKTIIVHLNDERRCGQLLDAATAVAEANAAHLIGLYVVPPVLVGSATHFGGRIMASGRNTFHEEAARIKAAFDKATTGRTLVPEWRLLEPTHDHPGCAEAVLEQARAVDLVVASQSDPTFEHHLLLDFADRLAVESGRPTLIVPTAGRFTRVGRRVLVAWNGKPEATRAVFDALPLLKQAEQVRILWVNPQRRADGPSSSPAAEIAAALARHGVKCEAAQSTNSEIEVSDDLLNRASDMGADLIVMGCYGHSRFREFVLGGASRGILKHMTMPVLMSH